MSRIESQAVGGFYKTQDPIRPLINRHFAVVSPSDDQTYAIVDPCAGEGEALRDFAVAVFGSKGRLPKLQIHAIELESDRYRKLSSTFYAVTSSPHTHQGDGLHASVVGNASVLWLNPPYDLFRGQRFESRFLRKWGPVVAPSGQLILIVPEHALQYLAADLNRLFEDIEILRYPEPEYSDFKQVVVLASRRLFVETSTSTALPPIGDLTSPPSRLRNVPPASMTSDVNQVDLDGVLASTTAWCRQAGYDRPAAPAQIGLAMRPKPAHVALALGSGVFNGVRLSAPGRPDLLAKAVFRRRYVDSESKKNEKGEEVKLTQVERPELKIVVLDLSTGEYKTLSPETEPTEATAERPQPLENFADLLMAYGDGMVSAMRQRCPALHNGSDEALSPLMREPFPAQAHAARTALKIVAQGETPLLLGEVGSGKSLTALQVAWSLHRRDVAAWPSSAPPPFRSPVTPRQVNRVLIVCPPHLVQNWKDEIAFALSHVEVHELCSVVDVDKLAASSAPFAIGLLSRETMKLGSGVAGVTTGHCPACGTVIAADFASRLAESRACCEAEVSVPVDSIARLAASMRGLSALAVKARRKVPPDYSTLCRLAVMPLLRLLRRQVRQRCSDDKLKQIVGALSYCDGDETRLRRILKRMLPRKRVWQYEWQRAVELPPEARREDSSSYSLPNDLATTFRVSVDAAKLYTALHALGTWTSRQCGERLYQHVPTPRRYPLARYITRKHKGVLDLLVVDECFVAGTLVDGKPIETLCVGDVVTSFDESSRTVVQRKVTRLWKKIPTSLVRVVLSNKQEIICTPNHPFLTLKGWCDASLLRGETVLSIPHGTSLLKMRHSHRPFSSAGASCSPQSSCVLQSDMLRRGIPAGAQIPAAGTLGGCVCTMPEKCDPNSAACNQRQKEGVWVLQSRMWVKSEKYQDRQGHFNQLEEGQCQDLRENEEKQSRLTTRGCCQDKPGKEGKDFSREGWEWAVNSTPETPDRSPERGFDRQSPDADGICDTYKSRIGEIPLHATGLQSGLGLSSRPTCSRGRRQVSQEETVEVLGPQEDRDFECLGVESVEILERGSDGKFGGMCPDGFVYNLEVEDTHTYFAGGILVHNCHEYSSDGSAQERALHRLVNAIPLVLPLTGSLMNGYAKSLFRNLWSVSRRMRDEFVYKDATKFAKLYGYQKRILTGDALKQARAVSFGSSSDRVLKIEGGERTQDAPGVLPTFVLRHVLPIAVTLHKRDIMPDDRVVEPVADVIKVTSPEHARWASKLAADLKQEVKRTRFDEVLAGRLFGQLNEYPSYFDRASADTGNEGPAGNRSYTIRYPDEVGGAVVSSAPGLPRDQLLDKERWLVDKLRSEIAEGRRVLLFLWHKDLATRLCRLVEDAIGEKPAFLDADKVPARKRQEWIDKNVVGKKKVMVTNPSCVMTGLNNLIWFSTAVFFENPGVNPFIARQAVGRLDRITQKLPVRVFWPVYEGVQAMLFELLQQKIAIAQQIDGIDPTAALEMVGSGDQSAASMDVGLAIWKYLGGD